MIQKCYMIYFFPFLLGIMIANFLGKDHLLSYGVTSFWNQSVITFQTISYDRFFCIILFERLKGTIFILLLGRVFPKEFVVKVCIALFMLFIGFFITMSMMDRGLKGMFITFLALMPQWIFYLLAFALYEREEGRKRILFSLFLIFLGCLSEGYFSPFFLKKVL